MNRYPYAAPLFRLAAGPLIAILILWGDNEFYLANGPVTAAAYVAALVLFLAAAAFEARDLRRARAVEDLHGALGRMAGLVLITCTLLALCKTNFPLDLCIAVILIITCRLTMLGLSDGLMLTGRSLPAVEGARLQAAAVLLGVGCALAAQTLIHFSLPVDVIVVLLWISRGALWAGAVLALITGALVVRRTFVNPAL